VHKTECLSAVSAAIGAITLRYYSSGGKSSTISLIGLGLIPIASQRGRRACKTSVRHCTACLPFLQCTSLECPHIIHGHNTSVQLKGCLRNRLRFHYARQTLRFPPCYSFARPSAPPFPFISRRPCMYYRQHTYGHHANTS
jgi:hypothetical protein